MRFNNFKINFVENFKQLRHNNKDEKYIFCYESCNTSYPTVIDFQQFQKI